MRHRKIFFISVFFLLLYSLTLPKTLGDNRTTSSGADSLIAAGYRASRILSSFPNNQFPPADYWVNTGRLISEKFPSSHPSAVWIVSLYLSDGVTQLNFPNSGYGSIPYVNFIGSDLNEAYLTRFDQEGFNIWLQVEPGAASIDTLIYIVLNRYKHHPCVKGFGIDIEWYLANQYPAGKKVTNEEAKKWEEKVKSIDTSYTLFLKHYSQSWMPPDYRGDIMFVDDSQDFNFSSNPFNTMVNEFKSWGNKFAPNKVAFQYGYPKDSTWWKNFSDPVKIIGNALLNNIPNCYGLFWVDFTITKVFPVTSVFDKEIIRANDFTLYQNFPNPFNPVTTIKFAIPSILKGETSKTKLTIYDMLGRELVALVNEEKSPGNYEVKWDASQLTSGVYFYRLTVGDFVETKSMLLLR